MKVMILYGTTEGQTRKIAQYMYEQCLQRHHQVSLWDATDQPPSVFDFDVIIICASIHTGRYQTGITHYILRNAEALNRRKAAFVSVSLTAAGTDEEAWKELHHITDTFLEHVQWKPMVVEQVAGALRYTQYDFFKKLVLKMIAKKAGGSTDTSHDTEYTDWKQVDGILKKLDL